MEPVDKIAFGKRVAHRRQLLFPSAKALADAVGMKQQGIDSIEQGKVGRPRLLRELASALKTTEEWLLWQRGPEQVERETNEITRVALLDWVSAGRLTEPRSQVPIQDVPLLAFADLGRGDFFALEVQGDSMNLVSPEGSKIIVNRADQQLVAGKYYVFYSKGEGSTYKAWRPARPGQPGYLEPVTTNTAVNKPIFFRGKAPPVVGRVVRTVLDLF